LAWNTAAIDSLPPLNAKGPGRHNPIQPLTIPTVQSLIVFSRFQTGDIKGKLSLDGSRLKLFKRPDPQRSGIRRPHGRYGWTLSPGNFICHSSPGKTCRPWPPAQHRLYRRPHRKASCPSAESTHCN